MSGKDMDPSTIIGELTRKIEEAKNSATLDQNIQKKRRVSVRVASQLIKPVLCYVMEELGFRHLSTITGLDLGSEIQVIYHLAKEGFVVSLIVPLDPEALILQTVTDIIPGATLYEREVHDLFGVKFEGHPKLSPLILPENWPPQTYPLRKSWRKEMEQSGNRGE